MDVEVDMCQANIYWREDTLATYWREGTVHIISHILEGDRLQDTLAIYWREGWYSNGTCQIIDSTSC